jgi:hypothetical protein
MALMSIPGGSTDRKAILHEIEHAQKLTDALLNYVPADRLREARSLRDQAIDALDWAKGLVDPRHAEEYRP